jgi:hypothetical protein
MANHLATVLARFEARVHNNKNRLVSIPADVQRQLRLIRQQDNHLLLYSIRPKGAGRWNHHWSQLNSDNEFAVPSDVAHIERGADVEVKIHRVVKNIDALADGSVGASGGAALLSELAASVEDERTDGSRSVDEYLYGSK